MADPKQAIMRTLSNEDAGLTGRVTIDNNNARVKYGINAADNPDLFDAAHPDGPSLDEAILRYTSVYWPMAFAGLNSQHIADQVFDLCVNVGKFHAAQIFQLAISQCGATVVVDGVIGPATVAAANSCNEDALVGAIAIQAGDYYARLAASNPADAAYLKGWLARVKGEAAG